MPAPKVKIGEHVRDQATGASLVVEKRVGGSVFGTYANGPQVGQVALLPIKGLKRS